MALLPWIPGGPVLDLGTGAGTLAIALANYGFAVTAVDRDPAKIKPLQAEYPQINWLTADLRSEIWSQQKYAAIVSLNVFPFLPSAEHAAQLQRLHAALLPGGLLIFSGFTENDPSADAWLAQNEAGETQPTGVLDLPTLESAFAGWECWQAFEGLLADDHPPHGPHTHGLVQVILKKPVSPPPATEWSSLPALGSGLGWRPALAPLLQQDGIADFIEIMSDDFLDPQWDSFLLRLAQRYTIIPHGVELSVGSAVGLDPQYLEQIARIVARCQSPWWSDHLCYTHSENYKTWSLNPLPCTEEALETVVRNSRQAMAAVGRPLLLENPAYYWRPELPGQMGDAEFLSRVVQEADCGILLDVANLYGNARNLGLDPYAFIEALPGERVIQIHLAGGRISQNLLFDTHDRAVEVPTWKLLEHALKHCGIKALSVERDGHYEDLAALVQEVAQARQLWGHRP